MKKELTKGIIANVAVLILLSFLVASIRAQAQVAYKQGDKSSIVVAGTSTLHDWTMTSNEPALQATFEVDTDGLPAQLKALALTVSSQSLKSERKAMDKNAYSALKTDKNKTITFILVSATHQSNVFQCSGNLSIAGVTKLININATCLADANKPMHCTGSKAFKMSDFQVEAPTFMFGSVKTGDEITISFNIELLPVKN